MAQLRESILKAVAYFDMFNYPITKGEILNFLDQRSDDAHLEPVIQSLIEKKMIWQLGNFYALSNEPFLAERRINGNRLADKRIKHAMRVARIISLFPFVRGVAISGSLSKHFAYKGSDLDFFVITAGNRLWISKVILQVAVRVFVTIGLKRLCCLNYYLDEHALEIEEKNVFTAVEVATLLPVTGKSCFQRFFTSNQWMYQYLPNAVHRDIPAKEMRSWPLKSVVEWLFNNKIGDRIDNWLMKIHCRRWKRQLSLNKILHTGFPLGAIVADKHMCKPDGRFFQQHVLTKYQDRLAEVSHTHAIKAS